MCEKTEAEPVSERTLCMESFGDICSPQKHNGSLTGIFRKIATVSFVQSSLTTTER